uniref:Uncharacterized protein n=1 Tax=Glossina austeni TaxID=7395 RepID=A0A1A9VHF5_GLOAU
MLLRRLQPMLDDNNIAPERHKHRMAGKCYRIVKEVRNALENNDHCLAVFLDGKPAFLFLLRTFHRVGLTLLILVQIKTVALQSYISRSLFFDARHIEASTACDIAFISTEIGL